MTICKMKTQRKKILTYSQVPGLSSNPTCLDRASLTHGSYHLTQPITFVILTALTAGHLIPVTVCPSREGRGMTPVVPVSSTVSGIEVNV